MCDEPGFSLCMSTLIHSKRDELWEVLYKIYEYSNPTIYKKNRELKNG